MKPLRAIAYARKHHPRFIEELKQFVRFPSVSNQPRHARDLHRCAVWLAGHLRRIGMEQVQIIPTGHHPIVYAASRESSGRPTILIYGHYDVQPAEPFSEWRTDPFGPAVKDNNLYGRGASDDKGQLFTHVKAIESYLKAEGKLPVNIKCIFEGDEEAGSSRGLAAFCRRNRAAMGVDSVVMSDSAMHGYGRPALGYSLRGNVRFELEVLGPKRDLHSGNFGGAVHNPIQALCEILASLHDSEGRVAISGFYDRVRECSAEEREYMKKTGLKDVGILRDAGVTSEWGEPGYSAYERITIRPALTLNGIRGGYQGSGVKTVIPSRASAKISIRIVPDQDGAEIDRLLRQHIARVVPATVSVKLRMLAAANPTQINRNHPALRAAEFAYEKGFSARPVFLRSGGTVAAAGIFQKTLGVPTVLMGFALPDDRLHAPNEKFHLPNFFQGIETSIWYLAAAAKLRQGRRAIESQTTHRQGERA